MTPSWNPAVHLSVHEKRRQEPVLIQRCMVNIFSFPCTRKISGDFWKNCGCASQTGLSLFSESSKQCQFAWTTSAFEQNLPILTKSFMAEWKPSSPQLAVFPGLSLQPALTLWPRSLPGARQTHLHSLLAIHLQELRLNLSLFFYWFQWHPL